MNRRAQRIASLIHRAVQSILVEGLGDPRVEGASMTVTSVKVDDPIRSAVVFVSIIPERKQDLAMHALRGAARHIRRRAGDAIDLRRMPELEFKLDTSIKAQAQVMNVLADLARERDELAAKLEDSPSPQPPEHDS